MKVQLRNGGLELSGYINVVDRPSEVLTDRDGSKFIETVNKGVWGRAIQQRKIDLLYNHKPERKLGDTSSNLELEEDAIGCRFRAMIYDIDIIEKAKQGTLRSCSFGFIPVKQSKKVIDGMEHRYLEEISLYEVSLLDCAPAYSGCIINVRENDGDQEIELRSIEVPIEIVEPSDEEVNEVIQQPIVNKAPNYKQWLWLQQNKFY